MSGELQLRAYAETWPVDGVFRISRGEVTAVEVLVVELTGAGLVARGESTPEAHFEESMQRSLRLIEVHRGALEEGLDRDLLQDLLPSCAARNALDCALWDLEAKRRDVPAWKLAGLESMEAVSTAYTISMDDPAAMAAQAAKARRRPLLKVKLGAESPLDAIAAVRDAAPDSRLIVDANEAWTVGALGGYLPRLAELAVELVEQPVPAGEDDDLLGFDSPVPLCADEACLDRRSLDRVAGRYQFINVKLDKTGGLTEALALADAAQARGLRLMVGCMLGTSLAMAPAAIVANRCEFADLDGPLLLAEDRVPGIRYDDDLMYPAPRELWG